jgi:hypothetical protein
MARAAIMAVRRHDVTRLDLRNQYEARQIGACGARFRAKARPAVDVEQIGRSDGTTFSRRSHVQTTSGSGAALLHREGNRHSFLGVQRFVDAAGSQEGEPNRVAGRAWSRENDRHLPSCVTWLFSRGNATGASLFRSSGKMESHRALARE